MTMCIPLMNFRWDIGLSWLKGTELTPLEISFRDECVRYFKEMRYLKKIIRRDGTHPIKISLLLTPRVRINKRGNMFADEMTPNYDCKDDRHRAVSEAIDAFARYLCTCGLSENTVRKHVDNISFFLNTYVLGRENECLENSHTCVAGFMGTFFIYKCMWATPAAIDGYCASFKKFYDFAEHKGLVGPGSTAQVVETIKECKADWKRSCRDFI